jgi:hypothetical protein
VKNNIVCSSLLLCAARQTPAEQSRRTQEDRIRKLRLARMLVMKFPGPETDGIGIDEETNESVNAATLGSYMKSVLRHRSRRSMVQMPAGERVPVLPLQGRVVEALCIFLTLVKGMVFGMCLACFLLLLRGLHGMKATPADSCLNRPLGGFGLVDRIRFRLNFNHRDL